MSGADRVDKLAMHVTLFPEESQDLFDDLAPITDGKRRAARLKALARLGVEAEMERRRGEPHRGVGLAVRPQVTEGGGTTPVGAAKLTASLLDWGNEN